MNGRRETKLFRGAVFALGVGMLLVGGVQDARAQTLTWSTIVNNGDTVPGTEAAPALFNSYNQPALNNSKLVVFRARGKAGTGGGQPVHGIYQRDMSGVHPIVKITARGETVPQPNNTFYQGALASFNEFPSTPRIDFGTPLMATRAQSEPVWTYQLLDTSVDPPVLTDTRIGTSGIYANPGGVLQTGASILGAAVNIDQTTLTFPWFSVPGAPPGTRFDQFPGGPAVTDGRYIVFKGNYTDPADGLGKTGVFYRDVLPVAPPGAPPLTQVVASSNTVIPNQPAGGTVKFGSTAPPSAANGYMVFTGLDIEEAPTMGGIYRARLQPSPPLQTLAAIGSRVPGEAASATFTTFGEGLSISPDGRYVSFWGAWGVETVQITLYCPVDGEQNVIAYCNEQYPDGYAVDIPVHQGIFVHDAQRGVTYAVAKTGQDGITDFLYWVFSGRPPGTGGGDEPTLEPPRWRSSAFAALASVPGSALMTAFKATKTGFNGIYVRKGLSTYTSLLTIVETVNSLGQAIDPEAPANSIVTAVGIERDGFRNGNLAVSVSMLYEDPLTSVGWAGLYLTPIAPVASVPVIVSVVARKVHGTAGTFDLPLAASPTDPTIEPRTGPLHTLVFTFDRPVMWASAAVTEGTATVAGVLSLGTVTVNLSGVGDHQYVTVSVGDILSEDGPHAGVAGSVRIGFLRGDVNQTGAVTLTDLVWVNAVLSQPVTASNYLLDVNASGTLTLTDKVMVNANLAQALPAP